MEVNRIKKALFSTAYLPPIEYFVYLFLSDNIFIEAYETYPRQTYRNRCYIYGSNGIESLHIPVIKPYGKRSKTKDVLIGYDQKWQRKHWRAICTAYSNSPFFLYYQDFLEPFYQKKVEKLLDFNCLILKALLTEISIKKEICFTTNFEKEVTAGRTDFRRAISHKSKYDNCRHCFQWPHYSQVFEHKYGFATNLSIIDLLFNKGPDTKEYIVKCAGMIDFKTLKGM